MTQTKLFKLLQKTITTLMCFWLLSTQMPINVVFADEINTEENIVEDINEDEINNIDNEEDDQIIIEEDVETINKEEDEIVDNEIIEEVETETSINQELKENINNLLNTDVVNITDIDQLTNVHNEAINSIEEYDALTDEEKNALAIDYDVLLEKKHNITVALIDALIESLPSQEEISEIEKIEEITSYKKTINDIKTLANEELEGEDLENYTKNYIDTNFFTNLTTLLNARMAELRNKPATGAAITINDPDFYNNYVLLEYIKNNDSRQYINTGLTAFGRSKIDIKLEINSFSGVKWGGICGTRSSDHNKDSFVICQNGDNTQLRVESGNGPNGGNYTYYNYTIGVPFEINYQRPQNNNIEVSAYPIFLFGVNQAGKRDTNWGDVYFKIYRCVLKNINDDIYRDFVPAYNYKNGRVGLYDLDNSKFYDNADYSRSGNFTAGSVVTYKITVNNTDKFGTVSSSNVSNVPFGKVMTVNGNKLTIGDTTITATPENNTKQGYSYVFDKWTGFDNDDHVVTGNDTITACFKEIPNEYQITLDQQSGSNGSTEATATYNSAMPSITSPTRVGYIFDGYYTGTNGSGTKYYNADGSSARIWDIDSATTLYAQWVPVEYTISYDLDNGITNNPTTYTIETDSFTLNNPTKEGFVFSGWTGTDLLEKTTTVTIENGSLGNKEYVANYDKKIDVPSAIEGLIYNDTEQKGVEEGEGYTLTKNIATEAGNHTAIASLEDGYVWSDGTYEAKQIVFTIKNNRFEVSFDVLGSGTTGLPEGSIVESIEPKTVKLGETYGNMVKPTYVGYTFIGWFLGDIEITEESTVELTDNVTLVARWNKIDALVKIASEDILANAIGYDGTYSYFDTFIKAVNSASENDELIIVKDFSNSFDSTKVNKSLTINIDNHTFNYYTINIDSGKTLTLTGNGGTLGGKVASSNSNTNINIDGDLTVSAIIDTSGSVQLINGTVSGELSVGASESVNMTGGIFLTTNTYVYGETTITGGSFSESSKSFATWNNRMDKNQYKLVLNEETDFYDVIELENVVSIGDIEYKTLATALQAAQDGDVLVLLSDIGDIEEWGSFDFNKKISLDLNNHSITYNSGSRININNDVTINGEGTINCWINVNDGTVIINDATLTKDVYIGEDSKEVVLNLNNVQNGDNSGYFFVKGKAEINVVDGKIRNLYARTNDLSKVKFNLSGNVYFEQIDFNNIPKENITITGGSYPYDVTQWLRDCYIATDTGHNSRHIVSEYVEASINTTKYKSFLEAYNAAQDGDTIKIERDIDFARQLQDATIANPANKRLAINKAITIDTNGYRLSYDHKYEYYYRVIRILNDVEFTGSGFVDANFQIDEGGTLTITGGTFEKTIAKHGGDLVLINGIFYRNDKVDPDDVYQANEPIIEYKTIEEYKQVMSECVAKDISHIKHVADDGEGYLVVEPHNFVNHYCDTVIDGKECGAIDKEHIVAEILNSNGSVIGQYFGFKEAIDAATTGQTVKLVKDYDETQDVTINKNITIDLNGYTLGHLQVAGNINKEIYINSNVKFIGNGNVNLGVNVNNNGTLEVPSGNDKLYFWNLVGTSGKGKLNVNSGNYYGGEGIRVYSDVTINYVDDANVGVHGGSLTINNGHFGSINTYDNKTATIKGGTFVNIIANSGTINIQGGSFSNIISGNVKIYGGKFVNEPNNSYIASGYIVTEINETEFFNNKDNNLRYEVVKGYEVTLDNKDATTPGTTKVVVAHNGTMPNITIPEKTGYAFDGYYDDLTNGTKYYNANGTSAHVWDKESDATLYAKWIKKVTIPIAITGLTYNGLEQTGVAEGIGYTLTGHKATYAGTYTAIATLELGYIWSDNTIEDKNITFTISPLSISNAEITLDEYDKYYCGTPIIPSIISVKVGDITLDSNDYEPTYSNNGFTETVDDSYDEKDAVVKVEAINSNFTESKELTYKIQRKAYSITLNLNGGHFESSEELPTTKLYGKPITIEHCPIKEGYSFVDYIDQENNHYSIGNQIETNKELQLKANWEIDETQWVAKVNNDISGYDNKNIVDGITYTYFNDLQTAIDNANGYTVTLLNNVTLTGNALEIAAESEVTLDLNQKIIDANYLSNIFKVFGKLTIDDSIATTDNNGNYVAGKLINGKFKEIPYKNGELYACGNAIYVDRGTLIINQGIINNCKTDESLTEGECIGARTGVVFGSSATITINGGLITNCSAGVGGAIFADYSNVTINGGTIENCKALEQDGQGAIKVYDNRTQFKALLTITGGTIRNCTAPAGSSGSVIYVSGTAEVNISGGTIIGAEGIEGDNFVKVHDQNNNHITGGWFSAPITSAVDYYCVGPVSDAVDTNAPYTVTNESYTITYKIKGESEDSYQEVYAPQGYSVKTTLKEEPTKEGYVFDGWYLNEDYTGNKYSSVTEYEINENTTFYAKWITVIEAAVAKIESNSRLTNAVGFENGYSYYDTLANAIKDATSAETKITLLKNIAEHDLTIGANKNVTLDLNGKNINAENKGRLFVINGSLTINDSTATGDETKGTYVAGRLINGRSTGKGTVGTDDSELGNAIFVKGENAALNINDGIIENCTMIAGKGSGNGTIYATGNNSKVRFNGGVIRNCTTLKGGAFYIAGSYFEMNGGAIINCESTYVGSQTEGAGAINLFCNTSLITGGLISGCEAAGKCGGIQIKIAKLTITGGVFENCTGGDVTRGQLIDVINDEQNRYLLVDKSTGIIGSSLEITGGTFVGADNAKTNDLIHISSNDENKITGGWYSGDITPNENYGVVGPIDNAPDARAPYTVTNNFYTITYDSNGGNAINPEKIYSLPGHSVETAVMNEVPTKDYETFIGWNTMPDGTGTRYVAGDVITLTGDITLYAQWQEQKVKVELHSKALISGNSISSVGQLSGGGNNIVKGKMHLITAESNDTYQFDHWDINGVIKEDANLNYVFTEDTVVYAIYRYEPSKGIHVNIEAEKPFTVKTLEKKSWLVWDYYEDGIYVAENKNGKYDVNIKVVAGSQIELIYDNTNNDFSGWVSKYGSIVSKNPKFIMHEIYVETDLRLETNTKVKKYYAEFIGYGNQIIKADNFESIEELKALANTAMAAPSSGYTFIGWKIDETLLNDITSIDDLSFENDGTTVKLLPKYEKIESKKTITISSYVDGKEYKDDIITEYDEGSNIVISAPEVNDQTVKFICWSADKDGNDVLSTNEKYPIKVINNIHIYAIYSEEKQQEQIPTLIANGVSTTGSDSSTSLVFNISRNVPEESTKYRIVESGILYSMSSSWKNKTDSQVEDSLRFSSVNPTTGNVTLKSGAKRSAETDTASSGSQTLYVNVTGHTGDFVYLRGYMIVSCSEQEEPMIIYTNVYKVSYNTASNPRIIKTRIDSNTN